MNKSPAVLGNEMQRDQKRESEMCAAFTISSVASVYYNNSAGDVLLENVSNVGCSRTEPAGEVKRVVGKPFTSSSFT
jgi:hypothetical protein